MRARITFKNGHVINASITEQIKEKIQKHYAPGKIVNIGAADDNFQEVEKCEIIN